MQWWASVLAVTGTFDQLTDFVIFAAWIFYGLTVASVFCCGIRCRMCRGPTKRLATPGGAAHLCAGHFWLVVIRCKRVHLSPQPGWY